MKFKPQLKAVFGLALLTSLGLTSGPVGVAATFYSTTVTSDRPLVYWNFDEADGNALQQMTLEPVPATTENDLLPTGGAARASHTALGSGLRLGNAADFNGAGFFRTATLRTGKPELEGAYAIEMWLQAQALNAPTYLANFGPAGGDNAPAVIYNFNQDYFEIFAAAGGRTGTSGPTMADLTWHHLVFVYYGDGADGVAAKLDAYLDGVVYPDIGGGLSRRLNLAAVIVGAALPNLADAFTGRIDEVAVYDLSSLPDESAVTAKMTALVNTHLASATATAGQPYADVVLADQPFLYWNFDEAEGSARQLAPIATPPPPDNTRNELFASGAAVRASHENLASGLQLGSAIDLDGASSFQTVGGLDTGIAVLNAPWAVELWFQFTADQANRYLLNMGRGGYYNSPAVIYGYFGPTLEVFGNGRSSTNGIPVSDRNWHHLLVVNYNTAPGAVDPGANVNRVDFFIDNVQYQHVGGGFNQPVDFGDWLMFGAATPPNAGGLVGRLDELALYNLNGLASVEAIEAKAAALAASHYAAAFGSSSVGTIVITTQPTGGTGQLGQTASFQVVASVTGTADPLKYQWLRNGVAINDATNPTYTTPTLSLDDIGSVAYTVRVSAGPAFKLSDPAILVVSEPPAAPLTTYFERVKSDQPLLYWSFDEWTGPALQAMPVNLEPVGADNDLRPVGFVQRTTHASLGNGLDKLGSAALFDGASYFVADGLRLAKPSLTGPWATEFWARFDGTVGTPANAYIANFGAAGADNSPAFIYGYTVDRYELFAGASGRSGANGPLVADNDWHHVLWVNYNTAPANSDNRVEVYVDGTRYPNAGGGFNRLISLNRLLVGAATVTPVNGFLGAVDEFAVYDLTGLDSTQIETKVGAMAANHYTLARTPGGQAYAEAVLADQPILYYPFDEADGDAQQTAPVSLPAPDPARNHLVAAGAGRAQHSVLNSGLYLGNTANFDGKGYFRAAQLDAGRPSLAAPWAVEFWMQVQGPNLAERQNYLLNLGENSPAFIYDFKPDELEIYAGVRTDAGPWVSDEQWHHVLWVYYGDGLEGVADRVDAYLDGVVYSYIRSNFARALRLDGDLMVGAAIPGYNGFQGRLDEVAFYGLWDAGDEAAITAKVEAMVASHREAATQPPVLPASITYVRTGATLTLSWTGAGYVLQQNDTVANPAGWSNVPGGAASPVTVTIPPSGMKYYRLTR